MTTTSKLALAAALIAGGAGLLPAPLPTTAAEAQVLDSLRSRQRGRAQQQQQEARPARIGELSAEESAAILPLYQASEAQDWAAASAALPAAQAGARTAAARYLVGQLMLRVASGTNNAQLQGQAVEMMLASGAAPAEAMRPLLSAQADAALAASNFAAAETAVQRLVEMNPNDAEMVVRLAQIKARLNKTQEANALYQRAMQLSQSSGQPVPEALYRQQLAAAYEARSLQPAMEAARGLLQAYPTADNWRSALTIYRELGGTDAALDVFRLMRATRSLTGEADYVRYAEAANQAASFGEVKAVLDEAMGRNAITATNSGFAREMLATAERRIAQDRPSLPGERSAALAGNDGRAALRLGDAFYGYGQYTEAAELYRAAAQKGADGNVANLRLGAALAQAGQRAQAEAALNAVTGPRAELAKMWLLWLNRQG